MKNALKHLAFGGLVVAAAANTDLDGKELTAPIRNAAGRTPVYQPGEFLVNFKNLSDALGSDGFIMPDVVAAKIDAFLSEHDISYSDVNRFLTMGSMLLKGISEADKEKIEGLLDSLGIEMEQNFYLDNWLAQDSSSTTSSTAATQTDTGVTTREVFIQDPAPTHCDRHDQTTGYNQQYAYTSAGENAFVYVIDTGINFDQEEFSGRLEDGVTTVSGLTNTAPTDSEGHGTHVAGLVGSTTYGMAKKTTIIPVKALDNSGAGAVSDIISALNWVISDVNSKGRQNKCVINMSLGGSASTILDNNVINAINNGCVVVVAAGNDAQDACNTSPARVEAAITVGAVDDTDVQASFSNFGSCVDIWAQGVRVTSTFIGSSTATGVLSGTSMASPITAGVVATLVSDEDLSPSEVKTRMIDGANNVLTLFQSSSPNRMMFSQVLSSGNNADQNGGPGPNSAGAAGASFLFTLVASAVAILLL
eukprot:Clim_evm55s215 gene=Clim_evmTU55s215